MRRLTIRQRFAFTFSFYVFILFIILCILFLVIFNLSSSYLLKKELLTESTDIINNYLIVSEGKLLFKKDEEGSSLKVFMTTHHTSAVFYDASRGKLRSYGLFAISAPRQDEQKLQQLLPHAAEIDGYKDFFLVRNKQKLKAIAVKLKSDGKVAGYVVLAKSLEEIQNTMRIMSMLFISLGMLNLIGSYILGYLLVRSAFMPLRKMVSVIEQIEYDKLDTLLPAGGHPSDELTYLSERFNEMLLRLKDMAERQKMFIANASHELKSPLARAISSLDLISLQKTFDTSEIRKIREDLFDINELIERLFLLTRLKKDIHQGKQHTVLFSDLLQKLIKQLESQLAKKQISVKIDVPEKVSLRIPGEYVSIIVTNVLQNSLKYSRNNSQIIIRVKHTTGDVKLLIKDEGVGIAEDDIKHIFDRFYRGKGVGTKGYGIGLSLVKQICDLYNISVTVQSEKSAGTQMTFIFPS